MPESRPVSVVDLPPPLRDFDPRAWGWSGPQFVNGVVPGGFLRAWQRFMEARLQWCEQHPTDDDVLEVLLRCPDEPWGIWGPL